MNWNKALEIVVPICAILSLIPIYFLIKSKIKKRYKFDIDYQNVFYSTIWDVNNPHINGRFCFVVYVLNVANGSDEPNTLKEINLSYRYAGKRFITDSYVIPSGKSPKGEPSIAISNNQTNIIMVGWNNIRPILGKRELIKPGSVVSGSAVFLFDPIIKDIHKISNLKIIAYDFLGHSSKQSLIPKKNWFKTIDLGFRIINQPYSIENNGSVNFVETHKHKRKLRSQ